MARPAVTAGEQRRRIKETARRVTEKAADEIVRLAVEKRKAEYRNAAQDEMRNLIDNANLLDRKVGDFKINSTF